MLAALIVLTVLTHVAFAGARVGVSLFALALGATPLEVGIIGGLFAALPMLFAVKAGQAVDRIGMRPPMLAGTFLASAGAALAFAWPALPALYFVAMLVGSGLMLVHIAVSNAAGVIGATAERARNFSYLAAGFSISGFLGPVLIGFAIDLAGHARAFLLLAAAPALAFAALASGRLPLPVVPAAPPRGERRVWSLLDDRRLRHVLVVSVLFNAAWDVFFFITPIYGVRLGLSASTIGSLLGAFAAATFLVRLVLPALARRVREWTLVAAALLLTALVFATFPLAPQVPVLMALAFLLGIGLGMSQPMVLSLLYSAAPVGRAGEAVGLRTTLLNVIQMTIPFLSGALGTALGITPIFWTMALLAAGGAAFARRRP
jgi:MprA protease rhombosortase-interaction domain-containing protein